MQAVTLFGFGTYFDGDDTARDIDLLIVHDQLGEASCSLAIRCKHCLSHKIGNAHVTMLSKSEEEHFDFVRTAQARKLGAVRPNHVEEDIAAICRQHI